MSTEHSGIADPDIHEPKGVAAAASGRVYRSDGAGSGTWEDIPNPTKIYLTLRITDVSTADSVYVVSPINGNVTKIWSVLGAAITGADSALVSSIGGVSITNGGWTVANSGSAAGDIDSATPTANRAITAGAALKITTDGASSTVATLTITVEITAT